MASQFYPRFIPSSNPSSARSETSFNKKRKTEHETNSTNHSTINGKDSVLDSATTTSVRSLDWERKHKKRCREEKDKNSLDTGVSLEDSGLAAREQKKLRSKFEKSELVSKISQKYKKNEDDADFSVKSSPGKESKLHGLEPIPQPEIEEDRAVTTISGLPEWITQPKIVPASRKIPFSELPLSPSTRAALITKGYQDAFAIQSATLPMLLPGPEWYKGDVCIASGTGTGKTLAFILPMIESLKGRASRRLRGLIVVPTRELVSQTRALLEACSSGSGLSIASSEGSKTLNEERKSLISVVSRYDPPAAQKRRDACIDSLTMNDSDDDNYNSALMIYLHSLTNYKIEYRSRVDVLICTPGRLVDHLKSTTGFTLDHIEWFVVDEVDRLLDQSYQEWIEHVIPALEHEIPISVSQAGVIDNLFRDEKRRVRKIVVSATLTTDIGKLIALNLYRPILISLKGGKGNPKRDELQGLDQPYEFVISDCLEEVGVPVQSAADKPLYLLSILDQFFSSSKTMHGCSSPTEVDTDMILPISTIGTSNDDSSSVASFGGEYGGDMRSVSPKYTSSDIYCSEDLSSGEEPLSIPQTKRTSSDIKLGLGTRGLVIFTTKNENALRLSRLLSLLRPKWSSKIGCLIGSNTSASRRRILKRLRKGELAVIVASNLVARGLNISNLAQVVNYDIPNTLEHYIHRVGRTARAEKMGKATTLLLHHEARWFWNEIARTNRIHRSRKVARGSSLKFSDEIREEYEQALNRLGHEARGDHKMMSA